jgi:hypothetical protein
LVRRAALITVQMQMVVLMTIPRDWAENKAAHREEET